MLLYLGYFVVIGLFSDLFQQLRLYFGYFCSISGYFHNIWDTLGYFVVFMAFWLFLGSLEYSKALWLFGVFWPWPFTSWSECDISSFSCHGWTRCELSQTFYCQLTSPDEKDEQTDGIRPRYEASLQPGRIFSSRAEFWHRWPDLHQLNFRII